MFKMFKDYMVQACLWSNMLYAMSYPSIHVYVMRRIDEKLVSVNQLVCCLFVIVANSIWNKYSDKLYRLFPLLALMESIAYAILNISVILGVTNMTVYYIADMILYCLISNNIICGATKLKSLVYNSSDAREKYDNTIRIASSLATIIGAGAAIIIDIPIAIAFLIGLIGINVDNVFYYIAYRKADQKK